MQDDIKEKLDKFNLIKFIDLMDFSDKMSETCQMLLESSWSPASGDNLSYPGRICNIYR